MPVSIEEIPGSGFQFVNTAINRSIKQFDIEAEPFVNGYSRVMDNNGFGFNKQAGRLISSIRFEATRNFSGTGSGQEKITNGDLSALPAFGYSMPLYDSMILLPTLRLSCRTSNGY